MVNCINVKSFSLNSQSKFYPTLVRRWTQLYSRNNHCLDNCKELTFCSPKEVVIGCFLIRQSACGNNFKVIRPA